jgi:hypothetical protein
MRSSLCLALTLFLLPIGRFEVEVRAEQLRFEPTVRRVVALLPRSPGTISVLDASDAKPDVRETLLKLDAFVVRGRGVIYLVKQSAVLQGAARGSPVLDCMLAAIIWHEMAHVDGAPEPEAQRREQELWTRFIRDGRVDQVVGLRYLQALEQRGSDDVLREAIPAPTHHFFCHTGYNQPDCDARVKRLREALANLDLTGLGEWTWVLVPSQEWKPILRRIGKDPESPAFTVLEKRQTFLEDALFQTDANRSQTLLLRYRVPLDQMLRFAVIHELAHAMCREVDEPRAIALADQLRTRTTVVCGG